ncbi:MAG: AAA family ATPase [Candidatus Thorarchaeota archaeon]
MSAFLKALSVQNYKSLRGVSVSPFPDLSVLVGANATGKSNFADAVDFLGLVFRGGLRPAVRAKGGYENIRYRRARASKSGIKFDVVIEQKAGRETDDSYRLEYSFAFSSKSAARASEYRVDRERLQVRHDHGQRLEDIEVTRDTSGKIKMATRGIPRKSRPYDFRGLGRLAFYIERLEEVLETDPDELFLTTLRSFFPNPAPPPFGLLGALGASGVYQISPFVARQTGTPERSPELGKHGENLPAAVRFLAESEPEAFQELLEHLAYTVPTMEGLTTDYVVTKQLGLFFSERGVGKKWFSQDVSDGTIQTIALFLPIVDPRKRLVCIEEPENCLHPWILRHFMSVCKAKSQEKQILLTTQSVIVVDETPVDSLYIVTRPSGQTRIARCLETNPEVREILHEQLMGLGEYWESGGIGGVPEEVIE